MNTSPVNPEEQESLEAHRLLVGTPFDWSALPMEYTDLIAGLTKEDFKAQYMGTWTSDENYTAKYAPADALALTGQYSPILKIDSRTDSSYKLTYQGAPHETEKAICFMVRDYEHDRCWTEEWFPKGVCSNLDLEAKTFYVWDKFMLYNKPECIPS